ARRRNHRIASTGLRLRGHGGFHQANEPGQPEGNDEVALAADLPQALEPVRTGERRRGTAVLTRVENIEDLLFDGRKEQESLVGGPEHRRTGALAAIRVLVF